MIEKLKINSTRPIPPIAVIGLGVSGEAALALLLSAGFSRKELATYDKKQTAADFTDESLLLREFKPSTLVVSPGVPLSSAWIQKFQNDGGMITSELELAFSLLTTEKVIAVTGSVGKSTTVSLLGMGARSFAKDSFVGGNLGTPLARYSKDLLEGAKPAQWIILELSSYQLENFKNLRADWSAIVSLTPNHMERYTDLEAYYQSKWSLVEKTKNATFINSRGGDLKTWARGKSAPCPMVFTDRDDISLKNWRLNEARLLGGHNQDNLALATRLALAAGWPTSSVAAMKSFSGLSHRLENLGAKNGILFINDSKATTIESVRTAVNSLLESVGSATVHLLVGGKDKNLPWEELNTLGLTKNLSFYFFGECGSLAKTKSQLSGPTYASMSDATHAAFENAQVGDLILLSPGGTSLDEFKNFEARGEAFKQIFSSL